MYHRKESLDLSEVIYHFLSLLHSVLVCKAGYLILSPRQSKRFFFIKKRRLTLLYIHVCIHVRTFPEAEVLLPLPLLCIEHLHNTNLLTSFQKRSSHYKNTTSYTIESNNKKETFEIIFNLNV